MKITPTGKPTTFFIPADDLRSAFQCASGTLEGGYGMGGVLIDDDCALVATDARVLMTITAPDGAFKGSDCFRDGTLKYAIQCDSADKAFKHKPKSGSLWVYGDIETGLLQFLVYHGQDGELERVGVCTFSVSDRQFPNCRHLLDEAICKQAGVASMVLNPSLLAKLTKAADIIEKGGNIGMSTAGDDKPILVKFGASPRMIGLIMPVNDKTLE